MSLEKVNRMGQRKEVLEQLYKIDDLIQSERVYELTPEAIGIFHKCLQTVEKASEEADISLFSVMSEFMYASSKNFMAYNFKLAKAVKIQIELSEKLKEFGIQSELDFSYKIME